MAYRLVFIAGYLDRKYGHFQTQKLQSSSFSIASFHSINQTYCYSSSVYRNASLVILKLALFLHSDTIFFVNQHCLFRCAEMTYKHFLGSER